MICKAGNTATAAAVMMMAQPSPVGCRLPICTGANRSRRFARWNPCVCCAKSFLREGGIGAEVTAPGICAVGGQQACQIPRRSSIFCEAAKTKSFEKLHGTSAGKQTHILQCQCQYVFRGHPGESKLNILAASGPQIPRGSRTFCQPK